MYGRDCAAAEFAMMSVRSGRVAQRGITLMFSQNHREAEEKEERGGTYEEEPCNAADGDGQCHSTGQLYSSISTLFSHGSDHAYSGESARV
jgi:hypothetical protein